MAEIDELFARIRSRKFIGDTDPFRTVHETPGGSGNAQPSGWYSAHSYSSFIGQTNLLPDPTFESLRATGETIPASPSSLTMGRWQAHYVLNSGTAPTSITLERDQARGARTSPAYNVHNSASAQIGITFPTTASNITVYLYPSIDVDADQIWALDWLVAALRWVDDGWVSIYPLPATSTAVLEIYDSVGAVVAASSESVDLKVQSPIRSVPVVAHVKKTVQEFHDGAWRWRLKLTFDKANTGFEADHGIRIAEPQIGWNYQPETPPYSPLLGDWWPRQVPDDFSLTGVISPAQLTGNTDNWDPAGLTNASVIRVSTDASRNLSGVAGGYAGRVLLLENAGSNDTVLVHDATSTAANRFYCPNSTNYTLKANEAVFLAYDGTSSRWRVIAKDPSSAVTYGSPVAVGYANSDGAATTLARSDHVHDLDLTTGSNLISGDVTLTSANTYYDGPSLSLSAGTWLLVGAVLVSYNSGVVVRKLTAKLWDGASSVLSSGETDALASHIRTIPLMGKVTVGSTTTYKISVACDAATNGLIHAAAPTNGAGNNASYLYAVRVG